MSPGLQPLPLTYPRPQALPCSQPGLTNLPQFSSPTLPGNCTHDQMKTTFVRFWVHSCSLPAKLAGTPRRAGLSVCRAPPRGGRSPAAACRRTQLNNATGEPPGQIIHGTQKINRNPWTRLPPSSCFETMPRTAARKPPWKFQLPPTSATDH